MAFHRLLSPAAAIFFLLSACSKDQGSPAAIHTDFLPVAVVETYYASGQGSWHDSSLYSYDLSNRLKKIVSVSASGTKSLYKYVGGSWFGHDDFTHGLWSKTENYVVNDNQRVDSSFYLNAANDTVTKNYGYNAANQCVEKREFQMLAGVRTMTEKISYSFNGNGDITSESGMHGSVTYTYVKDRLNALSLGKVYQPGSRYLIHSQTINSEEGSVTITHEYKVDKMERVLSDKAVSTDGSTDIKTYYY